MPRTCEENLANRAWASAHHRKSLLEQLLDEPIDRQVYARQAREALKSGKPMEIAAALEGLQTEVNRCKAITQRMAEALNLPSPVL